MKWIVKLEDGPLGKWIERHRVLWWVPLVISGISVVISLMAMMLGAKS